VKTGSGDRSVGALRPCTGQRGVQMPHPQRVLGVRGGAWRTGSKFRALKHRCEGYRRRKPDVLKIMIDINAGGKYIPRQRKAVFIRWVRLRTWGKCVQLFPVDRSDQIFVHLELFLPIRFPVCARTFSLCLLEAVGAAHGGGGGGPPGTSPSRETQESVTPLSALLIGRIRTEGRPPASGVRGAGGGGGWCREKVGGGSRFDHF